MAEYKIKKTVLAFGSTASTDLASAITNSTVSFGCLIESVTMPKETRGEIEETARLCTEDNSFKPKDTDEIDVSELSINGVADKGDSGYDAAIAVLKEMFNANTKGTMLMTHPDGTSQQWANGKVLEIHDLPDGGAADKIKFTLRMQMHSRLASV